MLKQFTEMNTWERRAASMSCNSSSRPGPARPLQMMDPRDSHDSFSFFPHVTAYDGGESEQEHMAGTEAEMEGQCFLPGSPGLAQTAFSYHPDRLSRSGTTGQWAGTLLILRDSRGLIWRAVLSIGVERKGGHGGC